jgi:hypothetical protein
MGSNYWIRRSGKESGPYDSKSVRALAQNGGLSPSDHISTDRQKWVAAETVSALSFGGQGAAIVPKHDASAVLAKRIVVSSQPDEVVAASLKRVRSLCIQGEDVRYIAVQRKPIITLAPDSLAITTRRLIYIRAGMLGKAAVFDWIWRDIEDVSIAEGIVAATVSVRAVGRQPFAVEYIPKECARALYRLAQEQEEIAREERRARDMEESRARAGGVNIVNGLVPPPIPGAQPQAAVDPVEAMKRLRAMREEGLITDSEYEAKRAEIVARM